MHALECLIEADCRDTLYQDYTATCLGTLVTQLAHTNGLDVEMPKFVELAYPKEEYEGNQPTAAEIIEDVKKRLMN